MTRILYTIPNFNTAGSGKVLLDLAANLDQSLFTAEICCFHGKGKFFKVVEESGIPVHLFPFTTPLNPKFSFIFRVLRIANWFRKNKFDLIHSWHWSSDWSEPLAAKLAGIPWVYTKKAMSWGNRHWKIRSRLASHVITINDEMQSSFFPDSKKLSLIPIGLDTDHYSPEQSCHKEVSLSPNIQITAEDTVLISVANFVPVKGIETLIEALEYINIPNLKLILVGSCSDDYGNKLKKLVAHKNLQQQVAFIGKVLDPRPWLGIADLFIIPTKDEGRKEGMPMAPVEAMSCGLPVLGSRISGIKYVLSAFPEHLFEASNPISLSQRIEYFLAQPIAKRQVLGQKARQFVTENFTIEQFIQAHQSLYNRLLM